MHLAKIMTEQGPIKVNKEEEGRGPNPDAGQRPGRTGCRPFA